VVEELAPILFHAEAAVDLRETRSARTAEARARELSSLKVCSELAITGYPARRMYEVVRAVLFLLALRRVAHVPLATAELRDQRLARQA